MLCRMLCIVVLTAFSAVGHSADRPVRLTQKQWEEISKGVDYTETFKDKKPGEKKEGPSFKGINPDFNFNSFRYVFYTVVVGLVLFLIIKVLTNLGKNPAIREMKIGIESIQEIEERMHEINLDELLAEALRVGNFRIALRIRFLIIIKMLSQKGAILWAKEKTNWEYHAEVNDRNLSVCFREIILSFEPVWYGEHLLTEDQYNSVSPTYEEMIKQLAPHE